MYNAAVVVSAAEIRIKLIALSKSAMALAVVALSLIGGAAAGVSGGEFRIELDCLAVVRDRPVWSPFFS